VETRTTVQPLRHRQTKGAETDMLGLKFTAPHSYSTILPLIPIGRLGEPEEIVRAVVFLVADEAGAITGATLLTNGGQYMV
jgi:NAD(P)-dependent dehydrogenase (short-subunit alcohol dehydrogenase family)